MIRDRSTCDESIVENILVEEGEGHRGKLRSLLLELRSFAHAVPPAPSAELSAFIKGYEPAQNVEYHHYIVDLSRGPRTPTWLIRSP